MKKLNQSGFHLLAILIVIVVAAVISGAGYAVWQKSNGSSGHSATSNGLVGGLDLECVPRGHDNYRTNQTLAVDPQDANIMYVGVELKGVYKTTDGGQTWKQSDTGIRGYTQEGDRSKRCIQELGITVFDPNDSKHILISRVESPGDEKTRFSENAGIWESKDAGASWQQLLKPGMNFSGSRAVAFAPNDSKTIYYGTNNSHPSYTDGQGRSPDKYFNSTGIIYKTTDGGASWAELPTGADKGFRANGIAIDRKDPDTIWFFTFSQDQQNEGQASESSQKAMMKSTDGGKTWTSYADKLPSGYHTLSFGAMNPMDSDNVVVATQTQRGPQKSFVTTDGGKTWQATNQAVYSFAYDTNDPSGKRLVGYDPFSSGNGGVYESLDKGVTWTRLSDVPADVTNSDRFGVRMEGFTFSPASKGTIYASGSYANVWKSVDDGKTWSRIMDMNDIGGPNKNKQGSEKSREQDPSAH